MVCPKCLEAEITKVILKKNSEKANLCNFCETIWLDGEEIAASTGHPFDMVGGDNLFEYTLEEAENKDQEHRDAKYTKFK